MTGKEMRVQRSLVISTRSQGRRPRSEVSHHSARPTESARPAELSSPHTDPEKVAQLGVGSRARGSRGRLCCLHRRAGVTPKAKIRLCAPKILYSKHCSAGNRPIRWLPARGPGQSRRAHFCHLGQQALATWSCLRPWNACSGESGHRCRGGRSPAVMVFLFQALLLTSGCKGSGRRQGRESRPHRCTRMSLTQEHPGLRQADPSSL